MVTEPITIESNALVIEAAKLMSEKKIGSVIVVEKGKVVGIVTERDFVVRIIVANRDSKKNKINDIMSSPVISISPKEDVVYAAQLMRKKGIKRLVVIEREKLVGVITTNDLARNMTRAVEELATTLYIMGKTR